MSSIWDLLLSDGREHWIRRLAWRTMRQFADPGQLSREFEMESRWLWSIAEQTVSQAGDTVRLLLSDRQSVRCEAVVLYPPGPLRTQSTDKPPRATVCVSSQPGCGVGCPFCLTASLGYRGNLPSEHILEQVYWAGLTARRHGRRLRNVVFMGMGEPLHNALAVTEAVGWLTSSSGFGLSPRHITVSTAGVPAAMLALARSFPQVRLALSLHSADPIQRKELVPRAVADLARLRHAIAQLNALQPQPVWIEIVLFDQVNDSLDHARRLVRFCDRLRVEINLIPYNIAGGAQKYSASPRERREQFAQVLRAAGIRTTLRTSLGAEAGVACGQLATRSGSVA